VNSMADSMARDRAVRLDITVPSSKRAREEEDGDAGGDVGPPEAQRARAGERAPGTVAQPAPPAAITSEAAAPGGGSNGGGGEPETAKTKSDQPAEKVSPAAATTTPNLPAGAATFESETYQLEVSRGGKGRGD
jgi:hypothetical protein